MKWHLNLHFLNKPLSSNSKINSFNLRHYSESSRTELSLDSSVASIGTFTVLELKLFDHFVLGSKFKGKNLNRTFESLGNWKF